MLSFQGILVQLLFYPFMIIFALYVLGKPRFIIKNLSSIWSLRITRYEVSVFSFLSFIFAVGALFNYYDLRENSFVLEKLYENSNGSYHSEVIENQKKLIFLCERGIFLYLSFFILTAVFVKFSDVYKKKYELEDQIEEKEKNKKAENARKEKEPKISEEAGKVKQD